MPVGFEIQPPAIFCHRCIRKIYIVWTFFSRGFYECSERIFILVSFQIENLEHCDFVPLRNMLIRTHLQDLKEVTNNVHYENFRCRKLAGVAGGSMDKIPNKNPLAQIEEERREHHNKMLKMEKEMEEVFERKVREKKAKLHDSEADLEKRHKESKDKLEQQKRELEARMAAFVQVSIY
jgi:septin 7